jgi:endoglucanase
MMVTSQTGDFLHITKIGGIDARVLPGQLVTVHGRQDLPGVIVQPSAALLPPENQDGPLPLERLLVDTGLHSGELSRLVRPGDLVSFAQPPLQIAGEALAGHSLDNRASVAALTACLHDLRQRPAAWDVWAVATTQEEETLGGALTSAHHLQPTLAVAIDVTFASSPGSPSHKTFPMGKGPTIGWGPNVHPGLYKHLKSLADRLEIPFRMEPMPRHSGTDAFHLQIAAHGIPTAVVGIPLRYMHSPVEMVSLKDIARAGRLLAEFAASLDSLFMENLTLD